ncbi:MAG: ferritin-like domain-containing protein [Planctomycetaceae bacterium]
MKLNSMEDLLLHEIKDLYNAEKQLMKALPRMAKAAASSELAELIEAHLEETEKQAERLEDILQQLGKAARGTTCKAMEGLVKEGAELIEEEGDPAVKDAALIAAAQRVEHYEIAGYGAARTFAQQLGLNDIAELLQQSLDEEHAADQKLNELAMSHINPKAEAVHD